MALKRVAMAISLTLGTLPAPALAAERLPSPAPEMAATVVTEDCCPGHDLTFPDGARSVPGAVYWEPSDCRPLTLGLYLPPGSVGRPPAGVPLLA